MCQLGVGNKMVLKRGRKNGKFKGNKKVGQIDNIKQLVKMMLMNNANDNIANNEDKEDKEEEKKEEEEEEVTMEENGMPSSFNLHANMLEILERMPTSGNAEERQTNSGESSSSSSVAIISSPNHSAVVNSAAATAIGGMADFDWPQWMAQLPQMPKMLEQQNIHNIDGGTQMMTMNACGDHQQQQQQQHESPIKKNSNKLARQSLTTLSSPQQQSADSFATVDVPYELVPPRDPNEPADIAEWRKRFEQMLTVRYAKSERIRFLFCRKMYGHYVGRMQQINRLSNELRTCKEKRMIKKFHLDTTELILIDPKSGKPYLCLEDIFDAIHHCHMQSDASEMRMLFSQLKEKYANITFDCVIEYFKIRNKQQKERQWTNMVAQQMGGTPLDESSSFHAECQSNQQPFFLQTSVDAEANGIGMELWVIDDDANKNTTNNSSNNNGEEDNSPKPPSATPIDDVQMTVATNQQSTSNLPRSKYSTMFREDYSNGTVHCNLCPFMVSQGANSSLQIYQKIRSHICQNHLPSLTNF